MAVNPLYPFRAGGPTGPVEHPRGASGHGWTDDQPTSSANLDGTRGVAPGSLRRSCPRCFGRRRVVSFFGATIDCPVCRRDGALPKRCAVCETDHAGLPCHVELGVAG